MFTSKCVNEKHSLGVHTKCEVNICNTLLPQVLHHLCVFRSDTDALI